MKEAMLAGIAAIGAHVPSRRVTNDELAKLVDTSDEWIRSHTGIGSRHIADDGVATSDLAVAAVNDMMARFKTDLSCVDGLIVATATQDYPGFPSTACVIQAKLGLPPIAAFDISAGCTGFIYAVEIARGMVAGGNFRNVLVVGAEKLSAITDWSDRNTCVLFGDAAGCALVSSSVSGGTAIVDGVLHSEGSGAAFLCIPHGGTASPQVPDDGTKAGKLAMDGRSVYNFAVKAMGQVIEELMQRNNLGWDDIDWVVPHQANSRIIAAAAKRLGIGQDKFFMNIESYANTSAASIPLALSEMQRDGLLHRGQRLLTVGFGAGLTYGGNYIIW
jgi:3-oxoacyl-[acyl-carrier-protein] synthase-3